MDEPAVTRPAPEAARGVSAADREAFARQLAAKLEEVGETREIRYVPADFRIILIDPGSPGGTGVNLGGVFDIYQKLPATTRDGWLAMLAREIREGTPLGQELDAVRERLLPVLRGRAFDDRCRTAAGDHTERVVVADRVPVTEFLFAGTVVDRAASLIEVDRAGLKRWGLSPEQALVIARENLKRRFPEPFREGEPGLYVSNTGDGYDAARLLLTERIRTLKLKGDPVAIVPRGHLLLITGTEEDVGLEHLAGFAAVTFDGPNPISGVAFRLAGTAWEPWLPPPGHRARPALERLQAQSIARDYEDQKPVLERQLAHDKKDRFVATCKVFTSPSGRTTTSASWTRGVAAWLPRTDELTLIDPNRPPLESFVAMGKWERIQAVLGHRMKPLGLNPERFEVTSFPDDKELEALR